MARYSKTYSSPAQLVTLLQSRGLFIENATRTENYLRHIGYYRFSAYLYPLLTTPKENSQPSPGHYISDSDVKAFLQMSQGIANPLMIQSLEKTRRNEVLRYALSFGAGVRQLSRLTGVSYGVVQKLTK